MPFHLDGVLFRNTFGTAAMRKVFDERAFVERFLEVEAALARAQAEVGLVPEEAAERITERASLSYVDLDCVAETIEETGLVSMSIIKIWKEQLGEAGEYVHYGATSQDIYDTALVLQMREGYDLLVERVECIIDLLAELAEAHRDTPMMGRTHYVHALPITFGLKVAVWVDEIARHLDRLEDLADRLFVLQFFGATGTLASLGEVGLDVQRQLGAELDLDLPAAPWFAARDRFGEAGAVLALTTSTASKIARQVLLLNRPEFGEVTQSVPEGTISSSTMPHKRNPTTSETVAGLAHLVRANADTMLELMETVDERSASTFYMEFAVLPELFTYASRTLANTEEMLERLEVHPEAMAENMSIVGDVVTSERVMMGLADKMGRQTAHELVYEHAMIAAKTDTSLRDRLLNDDRVRAHLSEEKIHELTDLVDYLGNAGEIVDAVLDRLD